MKHLIRPQRTNRPRRSVPAFGTALLVALLAALLGSLLARGSSIAPATSPPIDPRLVLHAHHVPIAGTLAGSTLRGSLYPGFPGANTIQIAASGHTSATDGHPAHLDLVVVMPGMGMVPARARLELRDGVYRGVIALPMFGTYSTQLTETVGSMHRHGRARLSLPLLLGT